MSAPIDPLIAARSDSGHAAFEPVAHERRPATRPRVAPGSTTTLRVVEDMESAYQRLYPGLVRLAFLLVDTQELAEEAVQDAFTKVYPRWSRIDTPDAYLRTCVINACRKVQRRRGVVRRTPDPFVEHGELHADHLADVVRALNSPMKEAVVLRYYLQLSEADIARTLGIAPGTVKSTLHRARALLKEELS